MREKERERKPRDTSKREATKTNCNEDLALIIMCS